MIRRKSLLPVVLASVLTLLTGVACEKSGSKGPLGADDLALLKQIPGGNAAVFGGNYMKMQDFMNTSLGKGVEDLMHKGAQVSGSELAGDFHSYMSCISGLKSLRMVGAMSLDRGLTLRIAMSGVTLKQIQACSDKAKQKTTLDPDGKFLVIDAFTPGGKVPTSFGYLALPTGAIVMRMGMSLPSEGTPPNVTVATRADLEADAAAAAKNSAADDRALVSQLGTLDRSKTMWFAGSGKGTPLASELGNVSGTMDISNGLAVDFTVQITDAGIVDQVDQFMPKIKQMKDQVPADYRSIIDSIKYDKKGDQLHFAAVVSDAQIAKLMKEMSGLIGAGIR
jgi:hypothetical protein